MVFAGRGHGAAGSGICYVRSTGLFADTGQPGLGLLLNLHGTGAASDWIARWTHLAQARATVLDVACGAGRHMAWFSQHGFSVTGIDRDAHAAASARAFGRVVEADIENGPWPLMQHDTPLQFDVVVVTNYLWRPLFATLLRSVKPGGLLLYETFACGNETVGKPSRPDFLLRPGELLQLCRDLSVVAYENGYEDAPPRFIQRIAAVAEDATSVETLGPARYPLSLKSAA